MSKQAVRKSAKQLAERRMQLQRIRDRSVIPQGYRLDFRGRHKAKRPISIKMPPEYFIRSD